MRHSDVDMLHGSLFKNVWKFSVPIILTSFLQLLFNAADLIVVSRYSDIGSIATAAVGATGPLSILMINMFTGLSIGAGVKVAQAHGAQNREDVHKTVHTSMLFAVLGGLFVTFVGICFCEIFLSWMGTPADVLPLSAKYMRLYFAGGVPMMVYSFGAAVLRAVGDSKRPLYFLGTAGVVNIVLNLIFVIVFKMDVDGVALATTLSQTLSAVLAVLALMRREDACRLIIKELHIYKKQFIEILKIGIPAGIQGTIFSISNVIIQSSVNSFGKIVMSGNAAAYSIEGFTYNAMGAFVQTTMNFMGQNVGAKNYHRLRKIMWTCIGSVALTGFVLGNLTFIFSKPLLSIYITDSMEAIRYGQIRLLYLAVPYFVCGMMDVTTGALRGVGRSASAMVFSILGICGIRIAWIFTVFRMPEYHSIQSLYFSYIISWTITLAIQLTYFMIVSGKLKKQNALGAVVE